MDSMYQFQQAIAVGALVIFLYYLRKLTLILTRTHKVAPPEPAGAWPIVGHLHLLAGGENQLIYRTFGSMADKYGPIFTIRLGMRRVLVVSNSEVAKECFTTNDNIFPTRPNSVATKLMAYNYAMFGFAPYGPYWREIRKIAVTELLSNKRLEMLKNIRSSEINMSIKDLYQLWDEKMNGGGGEVVAGSPVLVEMKRWFEDLSFNVVVRVIAGKRYSGRRVESDDREEVEEEGRRCQKAMNDFMHLAGIFVVSDAIPFLSFLDLQGYEKEMKKTAVEIDYVLGRWVEEHRQRRKLERVAGASDDQQEDFIDVMLSIFKDDEQFYGYDPDTVIKSSCLSLILGGNDTTWVTLTWALSLLLNNRNVLEKAQRELDIQVGRGRQVEESDINNLKYLQAIVKESMRLYPATPIPAPREAMEDCTIAGFHVPKGTKLMLNLWKLHRDPRVWSDPLEFKPERFLISGTHGDVDLRGQHFELLPFGSGRRICPGISFALQVMHLTLARLLHSFHLSTPFDSPVDMTETSGLFLPKSNSFGCPSYTTTPFRTLCMLTC